MWRVPVLGLRQGERGAAGARQVGEAAGERLRRGGGGQAEALRQRGQGGGGGGAGAGGEQQAFLPEGQRVADGQGRHEDHGGQAALLQDRGGDLQRVAPAVVEGEQGGARRQGGAAGEMVQHAIQRHHLEQAGGDIEGGGELCRGEHVFVEGGLALRVGGRQDAVEHQRGERRGGALRQAAGVVARRQQGILGGGGEPEAGRVHTRRHCTSV
jgi:hypothetical protein